jgi:hypothetical protein
MCENARFTTFVGISVPDATDTKPIDADRFRRTKGNAHIEIAEQGSGGGQGGRDDGG